jgi:hypothetical protein
MRENKKDKSVSPIHPGEILLEDFMKPLGLSQYRLAHDIGVTPIRISQIVNGERSITVVKAAPKKCAPRQLTPGHKPGRWAGTMTSREGSPSPFSTPFVSPCPRGRNYLNFARNRDAVDGE